MKRSAAIAVVALMGICGVSACGAATLSRPAPSISCLKSHKLFAAVDPLALRNANLRPFSTATLIFGSRNGDNGYILFYRSATQAKEAAAAWVAGMRKTIGIPHLAVPGVRQTVGNVLIDWIAGPKTSASRQLVAACLR